MSYISTGITVVNYLTNYSLINTPNLCNLLIFVLRTTQDDNQKYVFLEEIKLQLGITFFNVLKDYIHKKYNFNHPLVILINGQT